MPKKGRRVTIVGSVAVAIAIIALIALIAVNMMNKQGDDRMKEPDTNITAEESTDAGGADGAGEKEQAPPPVFRNVSVHDPSIIKEGDTYYVFGSHIDAAKSTDLMQWTRFTNGYAREGNVLYGNLSDNLAESFAWAGENDSDSKGGFSVWAPEVLWNEHYRNKDGAEGAYMIYYSASSTYIRSAIGFAVSQSIEGPYEYVDTIVYSGFTRDERYDSDSEVNKAWPNTNISKLINSGAVKEVNEAWFNADGSFANAMYPNAIDANLFFDENGKLWMSYGSWSGGIFLLELDAASGRPIYPGKDGATEDGRMIDRYFGVKIAGGFTKSGEGPYIVYDKNAGYYYLYMSYGWLGADGGYNIRQFRSEEPEGPYVDALGMNAVLQPNMSNFLIGNKIMGNFLFEIRDTGLGYGYVSPGHNSVYLDKDTGRQFLVFHARFPNRGEAHEVKVHQMFMNKDGWPVVAARPYGGEELAPLGEEEIVGQYDLINHGKDYSGQIVKAVKASLNSDNSITGDINGTWTLTGDCEAEIVTDNTVYYGVFVRLWDDVQARWAITFTALSREGVSIWGSESLPAAE